MSRKHERALSEQLRALSLYPDGAPNNTAIFAFNVPNFFYCYYRTQTGSLTQTAEQMGNSKEICKERYSRPVLKAEGEAWFNVFPEA